MSAKAPLLKKVMAPENRVLRILMVLIAVFIFYLLPRNYLGDTFPICLYRLLFGRVCFGCGTTRAVWSVLHLEIREAIRYNKFIVVIFPLLIGCIVSWIRKRK